MAGMEGIVGAARKTVEFVIQPIEGKLLGIGKELSGIVKKAIQAAEGKIAMDNLRRDTIEMEKYSKEAYDRQVTNKEFDKKAYKETVYR